MSSLDRIQAFNRNWRLRSQDKASHQQCELGCSTANIHSPASVALSDVNVYQEMLIDNARRARALFAGLCLVRITVVGAGHARDWGPAALSRAWPALTIVLLTRGMGVLNRHLIVRHDLYAARNYTASKPTEMLQASIEPDANHGNHAEHDGVAIL